MIVSITSMPYSSTLYQKRTRIFRFAGIVFSISNSSALLFTTLNSYLLVHGAILGAAMFVYSELRRRNANQGVRVNESWNFLFSAWINIQLIVFYLLYQNFETLIVSVGLLSQLLIYKTKNDALESKWFTGIITVYGVLMTGSILFGSEPAEHLALLQSPEYMKLGDFMELVIVSAALVVNILFFKSAVRASEYVTTYERKTKLVVDRLNKIVAHNLRTPITTLQMQLEMQRLKGEPYEELEPLVQSLVQTTDDVFSFDSNYENLALDTLVVRLRDFFGERVEFEVDTDENHQILAANIYYFALHNFISNAIKYSSEKPVVRFLTYLGYLLVSVEDTGQGMSSERIESLGQKLNSSQGLGVGLAISVELLNAFGYTIEVQSQLGTGTLVLISRESKAVDAFGNSDWPKAVFKVVEAEDQAVGLL